MHTRNQKSVALVCALLLSLLTPFVVLANSAEPPRLIVIVNMPPADLTLSVRLTDGSEIELMRQDKAWESRFVLASHLFRQNPSIKGAALIVHSSEKNFEHPLPDDMLDRYNNVLSLNVRNETFTDGQTFARSAILVGLRVTLTLLIEGAIFFLFGYRTKRSWIVFFVVNLATQTWLNISLNASFTNSYPILNLLFYEFLILFAEMIAFAIAVNEKKRWVTLVYVLIANVASFLLGAALIMMLPV